MVWSGFAEGMDLQQLAWILRCVGGGGNRKPHIFKMYIFAENIQRAFESTTGPGPEPHLFSWRSKECTGSLTQVTPIFCMQPLPASNSQLLLFPNAGWVRKLLKPLSTKYIYLSKTQWAWIQLQQTCWALVTVMKWSHSAKLHQEENIFYLFTET